MLEAARLQFARCGLEAQMNDVAAAAGVGVGTVYRHFSTKEELIQALADEHLNSLAEAAHRALQTADPWEGFEQLITDAARMMAEDRSLSEAMDQRPAVWLAAAEAVDLVVVVGEVVGRAQASGQLRADIVPWDIPSLVLGIGRAVRADHELPAMSLERCLDIVLAGLRTGRPVAAS